MSCFGRNPTMARMCQCFQPDVFWWHLPYGSFSRRSDAEKRKQLFEELEEAEENHSMMSASISVRPAATDHVHANDTKMH